MAPPELARRHGVRARLVPGQLFPAVVPGQAGLFLPRIGRPVLMLAAAPIVRLRQCGGRS